MKKAAIWISTEYRDLKQVEFALEDDPRTIVGKKDMVLVTVLKLQAKF